MKLLAYLTLCPLIVSVALVSSVADAADASDYSGQIAPLLKKYCVGCHNADDAEGKLSLASFGDLQKGGQHGRAVLPGNAEASRLIRVLTGKAKPAMPPKDEAQPTESEIALLAAWVQAGARGPGGAEPDRKALLVPKLAPAVGASPPITALAFNPHKDMLAVARFREVRLITARQSKVHHLKDHPGKINAITFSRDGRHLVVATGVAGLYGRADIWDVETSRRVKSLQGHSDTLYAAILDPTGTLLATGGYDHRIILWDVATGRQRRVLSGHNGAIYDLAFNPDGSVLASASGDETVKLWKVSTGERLDTLGQPLDEQYTVAFSPDGRHIVAGGADNRIRVWKFVSKEKPRINPLLHARYAHEGAVLRLLFSVKGDRLFTISEDRALKLWSAETFEVLHVFPKQSAVAHALTIARDDSELIVGRTDGSLKIYQIPREPGEAQAASTDVSDKAVIERAMTEVAEQEPNGAPDEAQEISIPAKVAGAIHKAGASEADVFRFKADAGEQWVIEINAARSKSPLDSKVEILDAEGRPVPRVLLRAVRDSYFTFRGKDSNTTDDFRLHNWQEMELNEYLYAAGEVVKLYHYPRGPDSGFRVYPNAGKRYGYFGTTAVSHALGAPCYIVQAQPPGARLIPNGLPVFTIYYENDDDSLRKWGADSRLHFRAPRSGNYHVRVTDARGFGSAGHTYTLTIRPRLPDFKVTLHGANPTVNRSSGKKFHVAIERIDGFDGPVQVDIEGVPPGFRVTSPIIIQAGHLKAYGTIRAAADAPKPAKENATATKVTAAAEIHSPGREAKTVVKSVNNLGEIKLADAAPLTATLALPEKGTTVENQPAAASSQDPPFELVILPGQTITATLRVERRGHKGLVSFGNDEAGWNLPHGVFVDNIGLNGVLIPAGETQRTIFITAAKWVPETSRLFFLESKQGGNQTTQPVMLHVRRRPSANEN